VTTIIEIYQRRVEILNYIKTEPSLTLHSQALVIGYLKQMTVRI